MRPRLALLPFALSAAALVACASTPGPAPNSALIPAPAPAPAPQPQASAAAPAASILDAPDRSPEDRALDHGRRPVEFFAFAGVKPGMHVADIGAWMGYSAELLARAVSPDGVVYAVDPPMAEKYTRKTWAERMARPVSARITRLTRSYEDPFPPGTAPLDVVFSILFYHDTVWLKTDRGKMNQAIFRALKPGGFYVIADHHAKAGDGTKVTQSLHRIEESSLVEEVKAAGFVLDAESDMLRHPEDTRDWSDSDEAPAEKRGTSDRFVLRFKKPG